MLTGTQIRVNPDMLPGSYIGYDARGEPVMTAVCGVGALKHSDEIVASFEVAPDVWEEIMAASTPMVEAVR